MNQESGISELEREVIDFFVNAAQAFGIPKSVGEIYGLFFVSETALALDQVIEKLQISKGSASQGIRFLKSIKALNTTYKPGDRRDLYTAETSLREIADGFMRERIKTQLDSNTARIKQLRLDNHIGSSPFLNDRIKTIESWSKKADLLLPTVSHFLGSKKNKQPNTII